MRIVGIFILFISINSFSQTNKCEDVLTNSKNRIDTLESIQFTATNYIVKNNDTVHFGKANIILQKNKHLQDNYIKCNINFSGITGYLDRVNIISSEESTYLFKSDSLVFYQDTTIDKVSITRNIYSEMIILPFNVVENPFESELNDYNLKRYDYTCSDTVLNTSDSCYVIKVEESSKLSNSRTWYIEKRNYKIRKYENLYLVNNEAINNVVQFNVIKENFSFNYDRFILKNISRERIKAIQIKAE